MEKLQIMVKKSLDKLKVTAKLEEKEGESLHRYTLSAYRGNLELKGSDLFACAQGLSLLEISSKAGEQSCFSDPQAATKSENFLWISAYSKFPLTQTLNVGIPELLHQAKEEQIERFSERMIEMGYTTLILGSSTGKPTSSKVFEGKLDHIVKGMHAYGLRVLLAPSWKEGYEPSSLKELQMNIEQFAKKGMECDGIFWESLFAKTTAQKAKDFREYSQYDLIFAELKGLESVFLTPLYFYLNPISANCAKKQVDWYRELLNDVGPETTLAFSAQEGPAEALWSQHHPIWEVGGDGATPVIAVMNIGNVKLGEGLWSGLPIEQLEGYFPFLQNPTITGTVALTPVLPQKGTLLDGALWTHSQLLWDKRVVSKLFKLWVQAYHPKWGEEEIQVIRESQRIAIAIQSLLETTQKDKSEELHFHIEVLVAQLRVLERKESVKEKIPQLTYFIRDGKRMLFHLLQQHQLNVANLLNGDDLKPSFWTGMTSLPSRGLSSGAKVDLYKVALPGEEDSLMAQLFKRNKESV